MQKFIAKVGLTHHVVKVFEAEVNAWLEQGWHFVDVSVDKKGLRIICQAVLEQDNQP